MNRILLALVAGLALLLAVLVLRAPAAPLGGTAPVVLMWTTKSELNTAGFYVYRSEQKDGPYAQVNRDLIPASNDAAAGGSYTYTDTTALRGTTYYYTLEDVETGGRRNRHDPITVVAGAEGILPFGLETAVAASLAIVALLIAAAILLLARRVPPSR